MASTTGLSATIGLFAERWPEELDAVVERAERVAAGETTVLGQTLRASPGDIDWHLDFVSGDRWPAKFHARYSYAELLDLERSSDVKIPWELSRLQELPALALAHRLTGDPRFLTALAERLGAWKAANPCGYGINWVVGMEVALRAINLTVAADLLGEGAGEHSPGGLELLDLPDLLARHGRFLARNLEYSDVSGNHYTACLLGLLVLGITLPTETEAARWRTTARTELALEAVRQVHPDGVCHEGSIPYHRLVLEMFLVALLAARSHGLALDPSVADRVAGMLRFVAAYTRPDGRAPTWGDDDDGRVLRLSVRDVRDHRGLLAAGCGLLGVGAVDLERGPAAPPALEPALFADAAALAALADRPAASPSPRTSVAFPDGGFYVLARGEDHCLVDCGDVGLRGRGGHGHNDALSCELSLAGQPVLTDTGCAAYTRSPADRRATLSAASHNVATVGGAEPAEISMARFPHATRCPVEVVGFDAAAGRFAGRHHGWVGRGIAGPYERRVELGPRPGELTVADRIERGPGEGGPVEVTWWFQLAEGWEPAGRERDGLLEWRDAAGRKLVLQHEVESEGAPAEPSEARVPWYPAYGVRRERWRLALRARAPLPVAARFRWRLVPAEGG